MKLILNNGKEYYIPDNSQIVNNRITIECDTEAECLVLKDELTLENLKKYTIEQRLGVTTVKENKKYMNNYQMQKVTITEDIVTPTTTTNESGEKITIEETSEVTKDVFRCTYFLEDVSNVEVAIADTNTTVNTVQAHVDYLAMMMEVEI